MGVEEGPGEVEEEGGEGAGWRWRGWICQGSLKVGWLLIGVVPVIGEMMSVLGMDTLQIMERTLFSDNCDDSTRAVGVAHVADE